MKKNVGVNLDEEELKKFEEMRDKAGFASNAEFIKARCLVDSNVFTGKPENEDFPLETPEEHRSTVRIANMFLGNLPIAALSIEEAKRVSIMYDVLLKKNKADRLRLDVTSRNQKQQENSGGYSPGYTHHDFPALASEVPQLLYCPEVSCNVAYEPNLKNSMVMHLTGEHQWALDKVQSVMPQLFK